MLASALLPVNSMTTDPAPGPKSTSFWSLSALWPPALATLLFLGLVGVQTHRAIALNHGHLIYPIDDVYGHMATAKNLVRHGIFGYSALDGFSSACSSLLWPCLVALCYALTGVHEWPPLVLNLLAVTGLLFLSARVIRRYSDAGWMIFLILAGMVYLTPLPALAVTGMEHSLQCLLCVAFVDCASLVLAGVPVAAPRGAVRGLLVAGGLLVMTRFEGLFLVGIVGLLLLFRRQWRLAILLGMVSAAPIVLFGLYSVAKGWYPLPNSLLLKGNTAGIHDFAALVAYFSRPATQLIYGPHIRTLILGVAVALGFALRKDRTLWAGLPLVLGITLGVIWIHLQYANLGWFFRYEAYLMVLSVLGVGIALAPKQAADFADTGTAVPVRRDRTWLAPYAVAVAVVGYIMVTPLWDRGTESLNVIVPATRNIYEQQFQMGLFLRRFYTGRGVAANDIGAIDYLADVRIFDLFGLANIDVLRAKRAGTYGRETVKRLLAKYDPGVIVVYEGWAGDYGGLLPEWTPVGRWTIPHNVICAGDTVTFFAPKPALVPELVHALRSFSTQLPSDVVQSGLYRESTVVQTSGTFPRETDATGAFYWTNAGAEFVLQPPGGAGTNLPEEAALQVTVRALAPGFQLQAEVNGIPVEPTQPVSAQTGHWVNYVFKVPPHAGLTTLKLSGQGTSVQPANDQRRLLFAAREPEWISPAAAVTR